MLFRKSFTPSYHHFYNLGISFILSIDYYEKYLPCNIAFYFDKTFLRVIPSQSLATLAMIIAARKVVLTTLNAQRNA
jgi:hypothetical protein